MDLSVFGVFAAQQIQKAEPISVASNANWEYDPIKSLVGSLRASLNWNPAHTTYLAFGTNETAADLEMRSYDTPTNDLRHQREHFEQLTLCHTWSLMRGHILKSGLQALWWNSPTGQFYYEGTQRKEQLYGVFLQDEWVGLDGRLTLDGGVRIEKKHISKGIDRFRPQPGEQVYRAISDYWEDEAFIVSFGSSYRLTPPHALFGRVAYSSQKPGSYLSAREGRDLGTETMVKVETGLSSTFLGEALSSSVTPFFYHVKNYRYEAGYEGPPQNSITLYDAYDVDRKGVELNLEGRVTKPFRVLLNYSYLHPNRKLDRETIPNHLGSLRLRYQRPSIEANLDAKFVGTYKNNFLAIDRRYHDVGSFVRVDANISWPIRLFGQAAKFTLYARNLTNQPYVTQLGFKDQGILAGSDITVFF
jgi:iron complex outermembrane receptor protein